MRSRGERRRRPGVPRGAARARALLFAGIASVTPRQCQIVLLADVRGLCPREIHARLGINERLFRLERARARRTLTAHLSDWREQRHGSVDAQPVGEVSNPERRQLLRWPAGTNPHPAAEPVAAAA